MVQQSGVIQLAQSLKDRNRHTVGKVQAAGIGFHRNANAAIPVRFQKIFRQPLGLFAEEQVAILGKFRFRIAPRCFCGKTPHLLYIVLLKEVIQIFIIPDFHHMPIVQTRAFYSFIRNVKAQRTDQVQTAAGGGTGTGDISAVLRDLRFHQNNIQQTLHP